MIKNKKGQTHRDHQKILAGQGKVAHVAHPAVYADACALASRAISLLRRRCVPVSFSLVLEDCAPRREEQLRRADLMQPCGLVRQCSSSMRAPVLLLNFIGTLVVPIVHCANDLHLHEHPVRTITRTAGVNDMLGASDELTHSVFAQTRTDLASARPATVLRSTLARGTRAAAVGAALAPRSELRARVRL